MPVPHDPVARARLTYVWEGDHWYLIDAPEPTVVLINKSVSQGNAYPSRQDAEKAFWSGVVDSLVTSPTPGWRIWRSDTHRWWATRISQFSAEAEQAAAHRTVDADTEPAVRALIAEQERRAMIEIERASLS